jgi:LysM repeat protein
MSCSKSRSLLAIPLFIALALLLASAPHPASAAAASAPTAQTCFNYTVQPGDWVWNIARRFGDSPHALIARNGLTAAGYIVPGQVLVVCSSVAPTPPPSGGIGTMRVVSPSGVNVRAQPSLSGTIMGVASYGTVMSVLAGPQIDASGMRWYNVVPPWSTPGWSAQYTQTGVQLLAPYSPGGPGTPGTCLARPAWYQVVYGDTLFRIAQRYCTTVASIQQANGIVNPNYIYPGQWLSIP